MICLWLFLAVVAFFFLDWLTLALRGDCVLHLLPEEIQNAVKIRKGDSLFFSFDIPLENRSRKEQALLIFASVHTIPEKKEDKLLNLWSKVVLADNPRNDDYFESTLVKPGKRILFRVRIRLDEEDEEKDPQRIAVLLSYSYYGRRPMRTDRISFSISTDAFVASESLSFAEARVAPARQARKSNVVPIETHLISPGENLSQVIREYAREKARPGDWVAIAESVVAIAQGRVYPVQSIRPGFWARRLNRFFQFNSSLASCYSMEWAIREAGLPRIFLAVIAGILGGFVGRSGDFYRIAGRSVAAIDDCTGTLPPFDKSVVLGPKDPNGVAEEIRKRTDLEVAIVDANDLGKVDILGKSTGIVDEALVEAIRDNPQGNADEQTPIVLVRRTK